MRVRRPGALRLAVLFPCALLAAFLVPAATAGALAPKKDYAVTLTPASVRAGVTVGAFTVKLTNQTGTQRLGSSNITVPSALTIVGAAPALDRAGTVTREGNLLKLRDLSLPPNASVTMTLGVRMTCVAGTYTWGFETKQSNDFNGPPGNTLGPIRGSLTTTVTESCKLRFVAQPANARKNQQIRAEAFSPTSPNLVSVEAIDGSDRPQRLHWFTGPVSLRLAPTSYLGRLFPDPATVAAVAGLASFPDLLIDASGVYNLRATTTARGFTGSDSRDFTVVDVAAPCNSAACQARLDGTETTSTVTGSAGADTGLLLLSLNLGRDPVCAGYKPPVGDWYEFQLLSAVRDKTIVAAFTADAMRSFGLGVRRLEICFAAPVTFTAKGGVPAQRFDYDGDVANGAEGFVGKLPDCPRTPTEPCIKQRSSTGGHDAAVAFSGSTGGGGGGAAVTFFVPAAWGDPRYH